MGVSCRKLDNTVWSSKRIDSDQQRSVVLPFSFSVFKNRLRSQRSTARLSFFYLRSSNVHCLFCVCLCKAAEVNEISQRAMFAEKHSKWYWHVVKPEPLSKDILGCWRPWAAIMIFFPLLLLSNFSLSPRNDLILLFLVQTPIFLSQLSQKLSRNTCYEHPWRSPVCNLVNWGFSWARNENYDYWGKEESKVRLVVVLKSDWKIVERFCAV